MAKKSKSPSKQSSGAEEQKQSAPEVATLTSGASIEGPSAKAPSRLARIFTLGHGIAMAGSIALLYAGWGSVFARNGTGSNVVLGLLLAVAVLYLGTAHLGPFVDDMLTRPAWRKSRQSLRLAWVYIDDIQRLIDVGVRLDGAVFTEVERQRLKEERGHIQKAAYAVQNPKADDDGVKAPSDATCVHLENVMQRADIEMTSVMGTGKTGLFAQIRSLGIAFTVAVVLRLFVIEPFQIPSGSMIPTLLIGDHLFVARFWYGLPIPFLDEPKYMVRWSDPSPGDVVVFTAPQTVKSHAGEPWIKRVIAGPGQRVHIKKTIVYVDDVPYKKIGKQEPMRFMSYNQDTRQWKTKSGVKQEEQIDDRTHFLIRGRDYSNWPLRNELDKLNRGGLTCDSFGCTVNEGYIFVMGDNRDNSEDGRVWGAVPKDNVKGRALFIWMSVDGSERSVDLGKFTLPKFRWERIFTSIQ
ncbi:MAG: signal peptidase I [Deltaproteobacteria bacterium]|nr:signal peptidase I [Deltaproteobacteria bacterium]